MKKVFMLLAMLVSCSVFAQEECQPSEKPHYFVADMLSKTVNIAGIRVNSIVSPLHKDFAACGEALEILKSKTGIGGDATLQLKAQTVKVEGFCIAAEICP